MIGAIGILSAACSMALSGSPDATKWHKAFLVSTGISGLLGAIGFTFDLLGHPIFPSPLIKYLVIFGFFSGFLVPKLGFRLFHPGEIVQGKEHGSRP